jgi:hypothetical protein
MSVLSSGLRGDVGYGAADTGYRAGGTGGLGSDLDAADVSQAFDGAADRDELAEGLGTVLGPQLAAVPELASPPLPGKGMTPQYSGENVPIPVAGRSVRLSEHVRDLLKRAWPNDPIGGYLWLVQGFRISPDKDLARDVCTHEDTLKQFAKLLLPGVDPDRNPQAWLVLRRHLMKAFLNGVQYVGEATREKYLVDVDSALLMRRGNVLDTSEPWQQAARSGKFIIGAAPRGINKTYVSQCRFLWVLQGDNATDYRLYSHLSKIDRFHHSSLVAGGDIAAAGEWMVGKGRIFLINGCSGHYQPEFERLLAALRWLNTKGKLTAQVRLELFKGGDSTPVGVFDVLNDPQYLQKHGLNHYPG